MGRRTNLLTEKKHMKFNPQKDEMILAHLTQQSDDTEEKVKVRLKQFHSNVAVVKGNYSSISIEVHGTKKPEVVLEMIIKSINSLIGTSLA